MWELLCICSGSRPRLPRDLLLLDLTTDALLCFFAAPVLELDEQTQADEYYGGE
jgi:hypothetical protein